MRTLRRRAPQAKRFVTGPFTGVRTTVEPFDDPPNQLIDATNLYIADPATGSGVFARPGFSALNAGAAITTSASAFRGQAAFSHTDLSGTTYNFLVMNGKLFRTDSTLNVITDVSPVGITIDASVSTRVFATSFANQLIMTDGVNKPWLATNLSATPITGTYIDYDGAGTTWAAFGPFVVYGGSVFCILSQVNSVSRRTDISWSNPGDASTGWQQTNYDFNWTLEQNGSEPLYALVGTNTALYYFRERSIGAISGSVGPNLSTTASHDAVPKNIGTLAPQSVVTYGNSIYFTDAMGRPYRLMPGQAPEPIWLQMRQIVDSALTGFPGVTRNTTTAVIDPVLNLYVVAIWSPNPSQSAPPTECYAFHAETGVYFGRWQIGGTTVGLGFQIEALGSFLDINGRGVLVALGSNAVPSGTAVATSGYGWAMYALMGLGAFVTTEATALSFVTTEDGRLVTAEGTPSNWLDGSEVPVISATVGRLGYSANKVLNADKVTALLGSSAPVTISINTAALPVTVEGTPTPSTTNDSVSRITCGLDGVQGRGLAVTVSPTTATSQWALIQVSADGVLSEALPDDV